MAAIDGINRWKRRGVRLQVPCHTQNPESILVTYIYNKNETGTPS